MFTCMNSKFIYSDKTFGNRLEELYQRLSLERCLGEKKTLAVQLALAAINPSKFAYAHMSGPEYTANVIGEVVHLVKCNPVEVSVRQASRSYSELPVSWKNKSLFVAPRTRLLQTRGIEVTCNVFIRPMFRLQEDWYALTPAIIRVPAPHRIESSTPGNYKYTSPTGLAVGGIYDYQEVERMRQQIMYPNKKTAITNVIARGMADQQPDMQGLSLQEMLNDILIEKNRVSLLQKAWGKFTVFGNIVAGLIEIMVSCKAVKWVINTLFHGKISYDLYGLSGYLMGALWDSVTTYFIHRKAEELLRTHVVHKDHSTRQKAKVEEGLPQADAPEKRPGKVTFCSVRRRIKCFSGLYNQDIEGLREHLTGLKMNPSSPHTENN